jgi:hypothetical protein
MRFILLSVILFCSYHANAFQRCAVEDVNTSQKFFIDIQTQLLSSSRRLMTTDMFQTKVIPVIMHVIEKSIPEDMINDQMDVMNNAFALTGFRFELEKINFVNTDRWEDIDFGNATERDMKSTLRMGDSATLNVYIMPSLGWLLGWATFPWDYDSRPEMDGVVIGRDTLPGGGSAPFNEGATLTHEVGHWMGLFHTFQGGCFGDGDMVSDTPAQRSPTNGCPINQNSCSNDSRPDAVNNFMDYSDDACMTEFSQGQVVRMTSSFDTYRKSLSSILN